MPGLFQGKICSLGYHRRIPIVINRSRVYSNSAGARSAPSKPKDEDNEMKTTTAAIKYDKSKPVWYQVTVLDNNAQPLPDFNPIVKATTIGILQVLRQYGAKYGYIVPVQMFDGEFKLVSGRNLANGIISNPEI